MNIENYHEPLKYIRTNKRGGGPCLLIHDSLRFYDKINSIKSEQIEKIAVKIPNGISHKIAASIMTKGLTTYYLLNKTYKVSARETILFHAAAGNNGVVEKISLKPNEVEWKNGDGIDNWACLASSKDDQTY